jgi:hypothetical protein
MQKLLYCRWPVAAIVGTKHMHPLIVQDKIHKYKSCLVCNAEEVYA